MPRILLVGYDPATEDFAGRPPGQTREKIQAGIEFALEQMRERGWDVDPVLIPFQDSPETVAANLDRQLKSSAYDCVVIGGGVRLPENYLVLEAILNAVHRGAPAAAIALNSGPEDSVHAAERRLGPRQRQVR